MTRRKQKDNSNYALGRVRALLEPGRLGSDGKLPTERALSETFGVGRRSVRRALEVLEAEGHIWRRQGSGTFAGAPPPADQQMLDKLAAESNFMEVMEVRLRLEPQVAQLAAMRASLSDVIRLREISVRITDSTDADGRELWDGAFHRKIAECADNKLYLALFEMVDRVRQESSWMNMREKARSPNTQSLYTAQHRQIIDAIAARDPERAGEAMHLHLLALQESLIRMMASPVTSDPADGD